MILTGNVGLKPSKARWLQREYKLADDTSYLFVSSYGEGTQNTIRPISVSYSESDAKIQACQKLEPLKTRAGVTDMEQFRDDTLLWTCSDGSLSLGLFSTSSETLSCVSTVNMHCSKGPEPAALTLSLSKYRREAVVGYENGDLHTVDIGNEGSLKAKSKMQFGAAISASAFRDINTLALGCLSDVFLWDVRSSSLLDARPLEHGECGPEDSDVLCVDAHPARPYIVVCGREDGTVLSWDTRTMRLLDCARVHGSQVWDVRFNRRNPQYLATCSEDGAACLFNVDTKNASRMSLYCAPVNSVDLHEDYNIVATVTETGELSFITRDL